MPTPDQARVADLLRSAGSAVVLTGAGISVPSGIPDFRSPGTGIWENVNPMEVAHISAWRRDPQQFWHFYGHRFQTLGPVQPNDAHRAVAELQQRGLVDALITQNIDRLHHKGGAVDVIEMHGSITRAVCLACHANVDFDDVMARIDGSPDGVPWCDCGAPLKPDVVLFGEMLDEHAIAAAFEACERADLILAIGSSLEVHPVAGLPQVVLQSGGDLVLITQSETPYDTLSSAHLRGDVVEELAGILAALG